jgi:hypothetical protein
VGQLLIVEVFAGAVEQVLKSLGDRRRNVC